MDLIDVELEEGKIFERGIGGGRGVRREETGSCDFVTISRHSLRASADRQPGAGERISLFATRFNQQQ
jgi:hypothetical protein